MSEEKQEAPEVQEENTVKVSLKSEDVETVNKVDLNKKPDVEESTTNDSGVVRSDEATDTPPEQEEVQAESKTQKSPVLEEITKEEVEEVKQGIDCGIRLGDFNEYEEGDVIECYILEKVEQTL